MTLDELTSPPDGKACSRCNTRPATMWWSDEGTVGIVRGYVSARCERCVVEVQLEHAREMAASIPKLEARLAVLGD